jgi:hypothetical protein
VLLDLPPPPKLWLPPKPAIVRAADAALVRAARHADLAGRRAAFPMPAFVPASSKVTGGYRNTYSTGTAADPVEFTNVDIGPAAGNRYIVLTAHVTGTPVPSSITVGGVSMTAVITQDRIAIWRSNSPVTSGTTATVSIDFSSTQNVLIHVYALYGLDPTAVATSASAADPGVLNLNTVANGVVIAAAQSYSGTIDSWTGVTQDQNTEFGGSSRWQAAASVLTTAAETPRTVSVDFSASIRNSCAVSFGPL